MYLLLNMIEPYDDKAYNAHIQFSKKSGKYIIFMNFPM